MAANLAVKIPSTCIQSATANQARKGRQYLRRLCPKSLWIKQAISGLSSGGQLRDIKGLKSDGNSAFIVEALTCKTPYMLWILHEIPLHHSVTDGNRKNVYQCNLFLALSLPYVTSLLPNQTQYILNFTSIDMLVWQWVLTAMLVVYIHNDKVRYFITCDSDMMSLHAMLLSSRRW